MKKIIKPLALGVALILGLAGCSGSNTDGDATSGETAELATIKVGASPTPHSEILAHIQETQAAAAGLNIEIVEFNDYIQPNSALADGSIDANYFQHQPFLDQAVEQNGYDLVSVRAIHAEPMGIYSEKIDDINDLQDGAMIAIPNDPTNEGRALLLLVELGLIELEDPDDLNSTPQNIVSNPKNLKFSELEAPQVPRAIADADAVIANSNFALDHGLSPINDAIVTEKAEGNPYANVLVVRAEDKDDANIDALATLLCSTETQDWIKQEYEGSFVSAC